MDLASFLIGLAPVLVVGYVGVVAFRHRHRRSSPLIVSPRTLVVEPDDDNLSHPPVVRPVPTTTTSQKK